MKRLAIVTCTKQKLSRAAPATELYSPSRLFARSYAQALEDGCSVLILSSKYGLVRPDQVLRPYEADLRDFSDAEHAAWERLIEQQLDAFLATDLPDEVLLFAGGEYRAPVEQIFSARGIRHRVHPKWTTICDQVFRR